MAKSTLGRLFFYDDASRHPLLYLWLKILLVWTPLACAALVLMMGGPRRFVTRWLYAVIVGVVCATVAIWGSALIEVAEAAWLRRRGRPVPEHGYLWSFFLGVLFMIPGLHLGFMAAVGFAALRGHAIDLPSFSAYRNGLFFGLIISGAFFLLQTIRDAGRTREAAARELARSERARLQARVAALTAQMNPHLLFNTLNTIASLIHEKPDLAEEVTLHLSELFRAVLQATRRQTQSLAEELDLCRRYLALEQVRFGDRLRSEIAIDDAVEPARVALPALTLQPLVENAIKYAVAPRTDGGEITIASRALAPRNGSVASIEIVIEDDGPGLGASPAAGGTGTGIESCRTRLALLFGEAGVLEVGAGEQGGTRVTLRVPRQEPG